MIKDFSRVLVIGVGVGGVALCIPSTCHITGLELGSSLEVAGHAFIDYTPPLVSQSFELHPASWTLGGDIYTEACLDAISHELTSGRYESVIVDVESGSPSKRLRLRQTLAAAGRLHSVQVYTRVLINASDLSQVVESVLGCSSQTDVCWVPQVGLLREIIVGGGDFPIGLMKAVSTDQSTPMIPVLPASPPVGSEAQSSMTCMAARLGLPLAGLVDATLPQRFVFAAKWKGNKVVLGPQLIDDILNDLDGAFTFFGRHTVRDLLSLSFLLDQNT
jgi:hypothetical protein